MLPVKFTSVNSSPQPYEAKDVTPIGKVETTSTPYSVKSLGLNLSRYAITKSQFMTNGEFETAGSSTVFDSWPEISAGGTVSDETSIVNSGGHSCKLTFGPTDNDWVKISQTITVTASTDYILTFDTEGDGGNGQIRYSVYDESNGDWIRTESTTGVAGATGVDWVEVEYEFTTPVGCTSITINLVINTFTIHDTVCYVDNVSLVGVGAGGTSVPDFVNATNLTLVDEGVNPLVGFYHGGGAPPGFSSITKFAYKYTGYLYARQTGIMELSAIGIGQLRVKLGTNRYAYGNSSSYWELDPLYYKSSGYSLTAGEFTEIEILYYTDREESGFTLLWKNSEFWGDTSDEFNQGLPLSAGITSTQDSFLTSQTAVGVKELNITQGKDESSTMRFEVPLDKSGGTGYYYDPGMDWYVYNGNTNVKFKRGWLVEGSVGYKNSSGTKEYVKKFTGNIDKITPKRTSKGVDTLSIECIGFENFLNTTLNLNYPDMLDYWISGYAGNNYNDKQPEGVHQPTTYDGWELTKVVQSLMIRGFIDPTLFIKKRQYLDSTDTVSDGSFLMQRAAPTYIYLDRSRNYGQPFSVLGDDTIDTSYIIESNFGDTITDYINKIVDPFGWEWGFMDYYDGGPFLRPTNNPTSIKTTADSSVGGFTNFLYDLEAINGEYKLGVDAGDFAEFSFKGKKIDAIIPLSSKGGVVSTVDDGSTTTVINVTAGDGSSFSASNRIIVQMGDEDEDSIIQSISTDAITISPALSRTPTVGSYFKSATFSAEVRRGTTWATATPITTVYGSSAWDSTDYQSFERIGFDGLNNPSLNTDEGGISGENLRFYYQGLDPRIVRNPCQFKIAGDLTFDDHLVRLTRLPDVEVLSSGTLYVDSLFVYDNNNFKPLFTYRTGDAIASGTVMELNLVDTAKDQRNETIVVGRRIGTETAGVSDRVINPNNPTFKHINSRALDMGSIINSGTTNFMGRPLQTIQIAPEISSVKRADHWASVFVTRYRKPERSPNYRALMNPLLEIGDCIAVSDESRSIINTYNNLWIESINTKVTPTLAVDNMETTSYEPWSSFSPRPQVTSLDNFGGKAIDNLTILQSEDKKVTSSSDPYNPYTSQESNNLMEVTYDLNVDADVKIDIVHQSGIVVATLLNPAGEEGSKGWLRQTIGKNYKVTWDGVDMFGDWNKITPLVLTDTTSSSISSGFYVAEAFNSIGSYERFFVRIIVDETVSTKLHIITSKGDFTGNNQWIYTRRGGPVTIETNSSPPYISIPGVTSLHPPGFGLGFFSDSNIIGGQDAGLKIGVKSTNALRRPSQLIVDIDMICFGIVDISVLIPIFKTVILRHPFLIRTPLSAINFTDFKDRSEEYNFYFDPVRWGYLFRNIDYSFSPDTLLNDGFDIYSSVAVIGQTAFAVAWYVKVMVKLIDLSGRSAVSTIYHRWDGPLKSGVTDTTAGVSDVNYLRYSAGSSVVWPLVTGTRTSPPDVGSFSNFIKQGFITEAEREGFGSLGSANSGYGVTFTVFY